MSCEWHKENGDIFLWAFSSLSWHKWCDGCVLRDAQAGGHSSNRQYYSSEGKDEDPSEMKILSDDTNS
jgi:hypothetical protein